MSKKAYFTGDLKKTFRCKFCGGEHRRGSEEGRLCRKAHYKGKPPPEPKPERPRKEGRPGSETTRYETDPLRGDKRAHMIASKLKQGMPVRKIAKQLNVPVDVVKDVERRIVPPPR